MHNDPKIVGQWIKLRRRAAGKSQMQLATEIGTGVRSIQRWEGGKNLEYVMMTMRLLSALGIQLEGGELPRSVSAEVLSLRRDLTQLRAELLERLDRLHLGHQQSQE